MNYPYGMPYQPIMPQHQFQQQTNQNLYYFVNGVEGAKSFQVQPNQTVMLMDSDSPMCYMKTANGIGQSTLRYFKLTEVNEVANTNVNQDYVLKADFDALVKRLDDLSSKIENTNKGGVLNE